MSEHLPDIPGYAVEAQIGRGGMGVVYRARRSTCGSVFAVKMILYGREASFVSLARFRVEAEALACLNHPNIIKIRDVGVCGGNPYFAMDYAERGTLKDVIAFTPQHPTESAGLVRTLAMAVQHAHDRGMWHRDLKPANVLLRADGTPAVTDFGIVKFAIPMQDVSAGCATFVSSAIDPERFRYGLEAGVQYRPEPADPMTDESVTRDVWEQCATRTGLLGDETRLRPVHEFLTAARQQAEHPAPAFDKLTRTEQLLGSPNYMAPEQAACDWNLIGPRTDVYALGGILYEMLTGHPPFRIKNLFDLLSRVRSDPPVPPRQHAPRVSAELEAVCLKCLEKSPADRYPSAAALSEDLARVQNGRSPQVARVARKWWWPFGRRSNAGGDET